MLNPEQLIWSKVSCLKKQRNGRDQASNHRLCVLCFLLQVKRVYFSLLLGFKPNPRYTSCQEGSRFVIVSAVLLATFVVMDCVHTRPAGNKGYLKVCGLNTTGRLLLEILLTSDKRAFQSQQKSFRNYVSKREYLKETMSPLHNIHICFILHR